MKTYLIGLLAQPCKEHLYFSFVPQQAHTRGGKHVPVLERRKAGISFFRVLIASVGKRRLLTR